MRGWFEGAQWRRRAWYPIADEVGLRVWKSQGLKPIDLIEVIGTTEVVPFYRALVPCCETFVFCLRVFSREVL